MADDPKRELAKILHDVLESETGGPEEVGVVSFWLGQLAADPFDRYAYEYRKPYLLHLAQNGHRRSECEDCRKERPSQNL